MRRYELLDARCGAVEARRQFGHLVGTLDAYAGRQVAGAERFHALLEPLEALGQRANDRKCAHADRQDDQREDR